MIVEYSRQLFAQTTWCASDYYYLILQSIIGFLRVWTLPQIEQKYPDEDNGADN